MEFTTKRKNGRTWIITPDGSDPVVEMVKVDNTIFKALIKAHLWQRHIRSGRFTSMKDLAEKKGIAESYVRRIINLNYLSPKIKEMILEGTQPKHLRLQDIIYDVPLSWNEQERVFLPNK
jgi:hypothetical protein